MRKGKALLQKKHLQLAAFSTDLSCFTFIVCVSPGMVPHASCYFVWLHAATTLQSEVKEKCDPKGVKGQAATAETFCSDIKLNAQSHLNTHTTTI